MKIKGIGSVTRIKAKETGKQYNLLKITCQVGAFTQCAQIFLDEKYIPDIFEGKTVEVEFFIFFGKNFRPEVGVKSIQVIEGE